MTRESLRREEFRALRAAMAQQAAARAIVLTASWIAWASLATAIMLVLPATLLLVVPLVVLVAGFEVHLETARTIDRMGRYIQVAFEERDRAPGWESVSEDLAAQVPGAHPAGLHFWVFIAALAVNYSCVMLSFGEAAGATGRARIEDTLDLALVSAAHGAVLLRFVLARRHYRRAHRAVLDRLRTEGSVPK